MPLDALLFDVDGTLVETNGAHIVAWQRAFRETGHEVAADHIQPEIGKGGDHLVPSVLGQSVEREHGEALRAAYKRHFLEIASTTKFHVVPGALELVQACKQRGLKIALASSSPKNLLDAIEASCDTQFSALVDIVTSGSDAKRSKPAPDLLLAAAEKLGVTPAQCALLGDTAHDATACRAGGIVFLAVLSGGNPEDVLREAGARGVWKDCASVLENLDQILNDTAPNKLHLTQAKLDELMGAALEAAKAGMAAGEAPIGAALFNGEGKLIASGYNEMNATQNKIAHAELVAFAHAAGKAPIDAKDLILVSSLEPCVMCTGAAMEAGVDTVVYALPAPQDAGTQRVAAPQSPESRMPRFVGGVRADESRALFEAWLKIHADEPQAAYVKQLLDGQPE